MENNSKQIIKNFSGFWIDHFGKLPIRGPWFYNWENSLRFDLQIDSDNSEEYFAEVLRRAGALFEFVFQPKDSIYLVYQERKWKKEKIRRYNDCFRQLENLQTSELGYTFIRNLYGENDKFDNWNRAIVRVIRNRIDYRNILTAIANHDFPTRKPRINGEVYFISDKGIGFNMYDDRGLDLISSDLKLLRPAFERFNDWLLDYDREIINTKFQVPDNL